MTDLIECTFTGEAFVPRTPFMLRQEYGPTPAGLACAGCSDRPADFRGALATLLGVKAVWLDNPAALGVVRFDELPGGGKVLVP